MPAMSHEMRTNRIALPAHPIIALVPVDTLLPGSSLIRRLVLTVSAACLIAAAFPRTTSAALSLALPSSDYPAGAAITTYPATNDKVDLLLSAAHRSSFNALHRADGIGWIQAAVWYFQTGKGAARQKHQTTFGYAISVFHNPKQARRALADARVQLRPHRVAHLAAALYQASDAVQSLTYLVFTYQDVEVEAYYEYRGTAPTALARSLRHTFNRQASHLVHLARVYQELMKRPAPASPTPTGTGKPKPTATPAPTVAPPTATPTTPPAPAATTAAPSPTATRMATGTMTARASANTSYAPESRATVEVQVAIEGQPVPAARIAANFAFPGYALSCTAITDANGLGACSVTVPQEGDGTQVSVAVQVVGPHGEQATTSTSFTVHR